MLEVVLFFQKHSLLGAATTLSGVAVSFMQTAEPGLRWLGLVIGVGVGLLTGYAKILDIKLKRKELHGKK